MACNLATSLRRRGRSSPFDQFDRLPPELRAWLAGAALPWSPRSVFRLWSRLLQEEHGNITGVLARLDQAEQRMLAKDGPKIWGCRYPAPRPSQPLVAKSRRGIEPKLPQ